MTAEKTGTGQGPVELRIDTLAAGGRGLAREAGRVWFVRGGLPGDLVRARPIRVRRRHVEAVAESLLEPSSLRRDPPCPFQPRCGGCAWMPLQETGQREWKMRMVRDALERIGHLDFPTLDPLRTPVQPLGYRNRMEFAVHWPAGERPTVGLHGVDPEAPVIGIDRCRLQSEGANRVLASIEALLGRLPVAKGAEGPIDRVVIRRSAAGLVVGLSVRRPEVDGLEELARRCAESHPDLTGIVQFRHLRDRRGGTRSRVLVGDGRLTERVAGFRFQLPAASFFQVNSDAAQAVLDLVLEMAAPLAGTRVLDLYGGLGLYALALVREGARSAVVCDADVEAVRCGRETAARHRLAGVRYVHADVRRFLSKPAADPAPQRVVMNPPRAGFGKGVAQGVRSLGPERVIVISCDPPTLARDLAALTEGGVFAVERIVPLDLFPQTPHVEVVVSLRRARELRATVHRRPPRGSPQPPTSG